MDPYFEQNNKPEHEVEGVIFKTVQTLLRISFTRVVRHIFNTSGTHLAFSLSYLIHLLTDFLIFLSMVDIFGSHLFGFSSTDVRPRLNSVVQILTGETEGTNFSRHFSFKCNTDNAPTSNINVKKTILPIKVKPDIHFHNISANIKEI